MNYVHFEIKISSKLIDSSTFFSLSILQQQELFLQQQHQKQRHQQFQCEINKSKNMSKWEGGENC